MPAVHEPIDPPRLDAGWLFLLAGLAILAATVLIPAHDDLRRAEHVRDIALTQEAMHRERLDRHQIYLDALERGDPRLARSLAASQLNLVPVDHRPMRDIDRGLPASASIFGALEPKPRPAPVLHHVDSLLDRLVLNPSTRLWILSAGVVCLLVGLLPPASRR